MIPDYRQLGCRVPAIVVSNLAPAKVVNHGPFEHSSTLKLIESTFGLRSLTARDAHAENLGQVLQHTPRRPIASGAIPTSSEVFGPVSDPAAVCSADSVQSVSPAPKHVGKRSADTPAPTAPQVAGMVAFTREHRQGNAG